ncbi:MAG: preprotein translocase subunit SecG [Desulfobacterales bacterium]|nr:preprotein translocase subunit SecG [Desulfobacterales bacterium]
MHILLVITHIVVSMALIMIVLLQTGKGADMGAAFGGGASQTLFGTTGASTFLGKATTIVAVLFMVTCLGLAYMSTGGKGTSSIMKDAPAPATEPQADGIPSPGDTADVKTEETSAPVADTAETQTETSTPVADTADAQPETTPDQPTASPTAEQPE